MIAKKQARFVSVKATKLARNVSSVSSSNRHTRVDNDTLIVKAVHGSEGEGSWVR